MTDIVERLRALPHVMGEARLCAEAADVIERLRYALDISNEMDADLRAQSNSLRAALERVMQTKSYSSEYGHATCVEEARAAIKKANG